MAHEGIAVSVEDLTRAFGRFIAVDHISLAVREGEIFGFLGPNGAGKSTTLKMLCGILVPSSGRALVGGYDVAREPQRIRAIIGYMSQRFSLYEDLRVDENLEFFGGVQDLDNARLRERKIWALEAARLGDYRRALASTLPGGVRQRLALACAMIHEPRILFLDEPTAGVDPTSRRAFWELIHQLSHQGVTVFVSTHYMDEAEHCDRLALIHRGRLVASGSPHELKSMRMQDSVLEVEPGDLLRMVEIAADLPSILDVTLYGNKLHVLTRDLDRVRADLREGARREGVEIRSMEPITPSLEDVFVSLLED
jgi:ABC-2 type transport system ATP-binding protein